MKPQFSRTTNTRSTTSNEDQYLAQFTDEPISALTVDRLYGQYNRRVCGTRQINRHIEYCVDHKEVVLPPQWHSLLTPKEMVHVEVVTVSEGLKFSKTYVLSIEKRKSTNEGEKLSIDQEVSLGSLNIESDIVAPFFLWLWIVRLISLVSVVYLLSIEEKILPLTLFVISVLLGMYLKKRACNKDVKERNSEIEQGLKEYYRSLDSFANISLENESNP